MDFHGFTTDEFALMNSWGKWLSDNCGKTRYNKPRKKFAVIGDVINSQMTREILEDVRTYHEIKGELRNITKAWKKHNKEVLEKMNMT